MNVAGQFIIDAATCCQLAVEQTTKRIGYRAYIIGRDRNSTAGLRDDTCGFISFGKRQDRRPCHKIFTELAGGVRDIAWGRQQQERVSRSLGSKRLKPRLRPEYLDKLPHADLVNQALTLWFTSSDQHQP